MNLRSLIPPLAVDVALAATRSRVGFTGYSTNFAEVAAKCRGYEDAGVVTDYRERAAAARAAREARGVDRSTELDSRSARLVGAFATACALSATVDNIRVLDFGGAFGAQYDVIQSVFGRRIATYTIIESPAVVASLSAFSDSVLEWKSVETKALSRLGGFDVVICSSTLQYMSEPMAVLEALIGLAPRVVLDRVPALQHHEHFVTQQHTRYRGASVTYPAWFFAEDILLSFLATRDVAVTECWAVPEDAPMVMGKRRPNAGYLLSTSRSSVTASRP